MDTCEGPQLVATQLWLLARCELTLVAERLESRFNCDSFPTFSGMVGPGRRESRFSPTDIDEASTHVRNDMLS